MPRYFFDLHNDMEAVDQEGRELPDLKAAQDNALLEARIMIQESVAESGRIDLMHSVDVRDETGTVVHSILFGDAISIVRAGRRAWDRD